MPYAPWTPPSLYEVARQWVDTCLAQDGSLFTPGQPIWKRDVVDEAAVPLLIDDIRKLDFMTKLRDQLDSCSDKAKQFTAELLYMHVLTVSNSTPATKRALIEPVLSWMQEPVLFPDELAAPFVEGVANYGAGLAQRDRFVKYFVRFVVAWKALPQERVTALLADPWEFRDFVHETGPEALMQREAILHLVFPLVFENALAPGDKKAIVKAFPRVPGLDKRDDDRALVSIRDAVEAANGRPLDLYAPWFRGIWSKKPAWGDWQGVIRWGRRLYESPELEEDERQYKAEFAERMAEARTALLNDGDWFSALKAAFSTPKYNLTHWQHEHGHLLAWAEEQPEQCAEFLKSLWRDERIDMLKLDEALTLLPYPVLGTPAARLAVSAALLMGLDSAVYPPYRATVVDTFVRLLGETDVPTGNYGDGYTPVEPGSFLYIDPVRLKEILVDEPADVSFDFVSRAHNQTPAQVAFQQLRRQSEGSEAHHYADYLTLLEAFRVRLLAGGLEVRDLLDVQGLVWCLAHGTSYDSWSDEERTEYAAFLAGAKVGAVNDGPSGDGATGAGEFVLAAADTTLADEVYLPRDWLQEQVIDLLAEKRQVIFFGPPGTGKTYVAQALAQHLTRSGGGHDLIQFHPSYSYEDFFEGYRPLSSDGQLSYVLTPGPLRVMAARAKEDPDNPYVLIVDEINRGNVPKIFGELLFLLEYRDREIALQHSPAERFSLPPNLYLIGTMNTADRSIALVDAALRRRFYFVEFSPNEEPVLDVLRLWLDKHELDGEPDSLLRALNDRIAQNDIAIGPSYFMTSAGSRPDLARVWRHSIIPLLEEYFYDAGTDVETEYGLQALRVALQAEAEPEPLPATEPEEDGSPVA